MARSSSTTSRIGCFQLRTCVGTDPSLVAALEATRIHVDDTFIGRAATSGEPQQAPDLALEPPDPHLDELIRGGWRSLLAVPLRWEQEIIGALIVRRKTTGAFSARTAELLETLASQSAVAIHNARVFRELQVQEPRARGRQPAQVGVPGQHVA